MISVYGANKLYAVIKKFVKAQTIESFADAGPVLTKSYDADILFLDIQMPGIDGMKAARIIRGIGKKTVIIFVTALEEQVFNAFDVGAFQYIVKP